MKRSELGIPASRQTYYDVYVENLGELPVQGGNRDAAFAAVVQHFATRLDHYCRTNPYNWFNVYDVWK